MQLVSGDEMMEMDGYGNVATANGNTLTDYQSINQSVSQSFRQSTFLPNSLSTYLYTNISIFLSIHLFLCRFSVHFLIQNYI
jgi:hypothetical protein